MVSDVIEHDRSVVWPMQRLQGSIINAQAPTFRSPKCLMCSVCLRSFIRTALLASLDALVSEEADDAAALTHEARQQQEAEVMGDLLAVERDEARLCGAQWTSGCRSSIAADCSPLAILQCGLLRLRAPTRHRERRRSML